MIERVKQYKYIINILFIEERVQTMRAVFKTFIFEIIHKKFW